MKNTAIAKAIGIWRLAMLQPLSKLHLFNHVQKKQLILTILNSTATKRETKNYFLKYQASSFDTNNADSTLSGGTSSGFSIDGRGNGAYNRLASTLLAAGGINDDESIQHQQQQQHPLRISIIKIKDLHLISPETLDGIGVTILKLIKLGVSPVLLIDSHDLFHYKQRQKNCMFKHVERDLDYQYFRLLKAIENSLRNAHGSFIQNEDSMTDLYSPDSANNKADNSSKYNDTNKSSRRRNNNNDTVYNITGIINTVPVKSVFEIDSDHGISLTFPQSILNYLHQGLVPIIYPIGFERHSSQNKLLPSDLLTENIALNLYQHYKNRLSEQGGDELDGSSLLSIEKIIYIEPTGGIPSLERMTSAHVLINLKQEYRDIARELQQGFLKPLEKHTHIRNLFHLNNILKQLPDSAAAIITTPQLAAIDDLPLLDDSVFLSNEKEVEVASNRQMSEKINISDTYSEDYSYSQGASINSGNFKGSNNDMNTTSSSSGRIDIESNQNDIVHNAVINQQGEAVTSFRIKNPIIYNILTDRPLISPSLPVYLRKTPLLSTTVLRKGIDVKFFRAKSAEEGLDLVEMDSKGIISLEKLKELIDDSFKKPLDLQNYLQRVNNNVAGLIFTENYEGGAIITWEEVKAAEEANFLGKVKGQDRKKPKTYIPYLDKFAVKRSVQGTFSVADIVFKVMVNTLFPKELIWRSRQNNPVNKWYHERSNGSMTVEGTQWRCFWVGSITREGTELQKYIDICKKIEPSWVTATNPR